MRMGKRTFFMGFIVLVLTFGLAAQGQKIDDLAQLQVVDNAEVISTIITDCIDDNEKIGAGLMIETDLDGFSFGSANGIVHVNNDNPGEYLLCLSTNERMVSIYKQGFVPLELDLRELGIRFQPRQVWRLRITGEERSKLQRVRITANVDSAVVYINEAEVGFAPKTVDLPLDSVSIRVTRPGKNYKSETKRIRILETTKKVPFFLEPVYIMEAVLIKSNVDGADIYVDRILRGKTPCRLRLPVQMDLKLQLHKEKYYSVSKTINILPGLSELPVEMQRERVTFEVSSEPSGAKIYVDGKETGHKTPAEIWSEWGMHDVKVILDDCHEEEEKSVYIHHDEKTIVEFELHMTDFCLSQINYRKNWWGNYSGLNVAVSQYEFLSESFTSYYPDVYGVKLAFNGASNRFFFIELAGSYFMPFQENEVKYYFKEEEVVLEKMYGIIGEVNLNFSLPIGRPFRIYAGGGGQVGSITVKPDQDSPGAYLASDSTAFRMNAVTAVAGLDIRLGRTTAITINYKQTFLNDWADYKRYTIGLLFGSFN